MATQRSVVCPENEGLAMFLFEKWDEMAKKDTYTDRLDATLSKAYRNLCDHKEPIYDLKDASKIKGIGNWTLKLLKEYFKSDDEAYPSSQEASEPTVKKRRGSGRYLPQKGSAPYAILITLYRLTQNEKEFMLKQELIDAAEASGLSRMPIGPSKSGAPPGRFGNSFKDWYSGWNSMKTLISKGLVVKSSCPAKYMLTAEGKVTGKECLERSGIPEGGGPLIQTQQITTVSSSEQISCNEMPSTSSQKREENKKVTTGKSTKNICHTKRKPPVSREIKNRPSIPDGVVDKLKGMGFDENEIYMASGKVPEMFGTKESQSVFDSILNCLLEKQVSTSCLQENQSLNRAIPACSLPYNAADRGEAGSRKGLHMEHTRTLSMRPCTETSRSLAPTTRLSASSDLNHHCLNDLEPSTHKVETNVLAVPPLENGNKFAELYDVILILDDREQFGHDNRGANTRHKVADRLYAQYQIQVEIRRLPIGDATWIARNKQLSHEYVLDFIVERKKVDDLCHSIRDNRYKDQKLRLMRCGIQKLIYLIEGDVNLTDASESVKSAAFTTEILEGFDVQRTRDLADTVRKYGNLTHAITDYYNMVDCMNKNENYKVCMSYDEFVNKCHDLEKETVSDVFGVQLMQVPQVTEDVALAVLDRYPTVLSLAQVYSHLEGDPNSQEQLLKDIPIRNQSKLIGTTISKNIYKFIWGGD